MIEFRNSGSAACSMARTCPKPSTLIPSFFEGSIEGWLIAGRFGVRRSLGRFDFEFIRLFSHFLCVYFVSLRFRGDSQHPLEFLV